MSVVLSSRLRVRLGCRRFVVASMVHIRHRCPLRVCSPPTSVLCWLVCSVVAAVLAVVVVVVVTVEVMFEFEWRTALRDVVIVVIGVPLPR